MVLVWTLAGPVYGVTATWVHAANTVGDWQDPNNWSPGLPGYGDSALIDNGGTASISNGSVTSNLLFVGPSHNGMVTQSGGTSTIGEDVCLGHNEVAKGTYSLSGGSLGTGSLYVGHLGTGVFTQSEGTNAVGVMLYIGNDIGSSGLYTLSGGLLETEGDQYVGKEGSGAFIQSGGTNAVEDSLYLGDYLGARGTYELSGGVVTVGGSVLIGCFVNAQCLFDITGGSLTVPGPIVLAYETPGAVVELKVAKDAYVESGDLTINQGEGQSTKLTMEVTSDGSGLVRTLGTAALDGVLEVNRATTSYRPIQAAKFTLITAALGAGSFADIASNIPGQLLKDPNNPGLGYWPVFRGAFDANADYVITFQGAMLGDSGGDNKVGAADLGDLTSNWGKTGRIWMQGDFNGDGRVNAADLGDLATNWGKTGFAPGAAPPEVPVPEPATVALLSLGSLGVIRRKWH